MKSRPFEQLFSVGTGFCMGFLKSSKTDHNPFLFKNCKYKAKAAQIKRFKRLMLELLGRFELPTSSLPTAVEPSSPCCTRLCGGFLSKKDEVAACLFHCFRPLISPCGSRCGSELFQLIKERRQNIKYDRADDCPVRILIMMHQPVPQSRDLHPRDIRILRPEVL